MMPLKENSPKSQEKDESLKKISDALTTDEIISLLSKSNKDFVKESEISSNITNLFKKLTPSVLAKKSDQPEDKKNHLEKEDGAKNHEKKEAEVKINEEKTEPEKKYTEEEAKKMANDLAKKYYENGYKIGIKKTTEELQKGEKSLAVTLKRTTDNLFEIIPEFNKNLSKTINNLIFQLCKEVIGHEIKNNTDLFNKKIQSLVESIEGSVKNVEVILNPEDYSLIKNYNEKNNVELSFKISEDNKLERGDLKIKSGSIEISEIVSNKIKFASTGNLDLDLEKLKETQKIKKTE